MKSTLMLAGIAMAGIVFGGISMNNAVIATSPPSVAQPATEGNIPARVAPVLQRACRDCHSNDTVWPWYSHLPPMSFMIRHDVEAGRQKFNYSKWADGSARPSSNQAQEICDAVSDHSMPPRSYRMMHREARLGAADVDAVCIWAAESSGEARNSGK